MGSLLSSGRHIWGDQPHVSPIHGHCHGVSYPGRQCPHTEVSAPVTHVWHCATEWLGYQVCLDEQNHVILESISPLYCHDYLYSRPKALSGVPGIASTGNTRLLSAQCRRTTRLQPYSSLIAFPCAWLSIGGTAAILFHFTPSRFILNDFPSFTCSTRSHGFW